MPEGAMPLKVHRTALKLQQLKGTLAPELQLKGTLAPEGPPYGHLKGILLGAVGAT